MNVAKQTFQERLSQDIEYGVMRSCIYIFPQQWTKVRVQVPQRPSKRRGIFRLSNEPAFAPRPLYSVSSLSGTATQTAAILLLPANS